MLPTDRSTVTSPGESSRSPKALVPEGTASAPPVSWKLVEGGALVRNSSLNFLGQALGIGVALIATPLIVRGFGVERFGVLVLAWSVLSYFNLFEFGISNATTKFAAEFLRIGEAEKLRRLFWTSLSLNFLFGLVAAGGLFSCAGLLAQHFHVTPALAGEAKNAFQVLAAFVPVVMVSLVLTGTLEAAQRYDILNVVRVPVTMLNYGIPALSCFSGIRLVEAFTLILAARIVAVVLYLSICLRKFQAVRRPAPVDPATILVLLRYGKWVALASAVWALIWQCDRFTLGALMSAHAVGYYAGAFEIAARMLIVSSSLAPLFPAFSALSVSDRGSALELYSRAVKHLLVLLSPAAFLLAAYPGPILSVWLGVEFGRQGQTLLPILGVAIVAVSISIVTGNLLRAFGRPDVTPKIQLVEAPLYIALLWFLIHVFGINGAALAVALRAVADLICVHACARSVVPRLLTALRLGGVNRLALALTVCGSFLTILNHMRHGNLAVILLTVVVSASFVPLVWRFAYDDSDRELVRAFRSRYLRLVAS